MAHYIEPMAEPRERSRIRSMDQGLLKQIELVCYMNGVPTKLTDLDPYGPPTLWVWCNKTWFERKMLVYFGIRNEKLEDM